MSTGVVISQPVGRLYLGYLVFPFGMCIIISAWALALSVQQNWAMRRPRKRGTGNEDVPTLSFYACFINFTEKAILGTIGAE